MFFSVEARLLAGRLSIEIEGMAYHHGDLRRALLRGAIELLAEGGPAQLTMRGAAQRAGVSPAAPYRHFTDKREMLAAVAEEGFLALERACVGAREEVSTDPIRDFLSLGVAYVRFAMENPAHYRVMFGPEISDKRSYPDLYRAATSAFEALRAALRACVTAGLFGPDEVETRAMRAWATVHGLASLYIDGQFNVEDAISKDAFLSRVHDVLVLEAELFEKRPDALSPSGSQAV